MNLKTPEACQSLQDIREAIDHLDHQIISLFSMRHKYVEEIVKFKKTEDEIIAIERKQQVIQQRKEWASENGLNPEIFEKIYTLLLENNIKHEMNILNSKKK